MLGTRLILQVLMHLPTNPAFASARRDFIMAWPDEELVKVVKAVLKTGAFRLHLDPVATGLLEEIAITRGDGLLAWTRREAGSTEAIKALLDEERLQGTGTSSAEDKEDAQHLSGIPDLDLIDSDEELDDEDDSEDNEMWRRRKTVRIPNIDVVFCVPGNNGMEYKRLSQLSSSSVEKIVRHFNHYFLRGSIDRAYYKRIIEDKDTSSGCLRGNLDEERNPFMHPTRACDGCIGTCLCARLETLADGEVRLAIYPLPEIDASFAPWNSADFWMEDYAQ